MEQEIVLCEVNEANRAAVARLFHDAWHETQAPLQDPVKVKYRGIGFFEDRLRSRSNTCAAYGNDQLAGFVSWSDDALNSLFVHKDFRNQGVGFKLLKFAEEQMFNVGHARIELKCVYGNTAAKRFYERHGWRADRIAVDEREKPEGVIFSKLWMMVKP
jgi:GNAT superfamily N-acetyltransferase